MKKDSLKVYTTITLMLVASLSLQKVDFSNINNIGKIQTTASTPATRPTPIPIVRETVVPEVVKSDAPTPVPTPLMVEKQEISKPSVDKEENLPTPVPAPSRPVALEQDSENIKHLKI